MDVSKRIDLEDVGIDVDDALNRFMGQEELFDKFMKRIPDDEYWTTLVGAVEAGNCTVAFSASHALKSVYGNLSIMPLYKLICEQTEYFRHNEFDKGKALMPKVISVHDEVCNAIKMIYHL